MNPREPVLQDPTDAGVDNTQGEFSDIARLEELRGALASDLDVQTIGLCSWTPNGGCRLVAVIGPADAEPLVDNASRERALLERAPAVLPDLGGREIRSWLLIPLDGSCAPNTGDERHLWVGLATHADSVSVDDLRATRDAARDWLSCERATCAARTPSPISRAILDAVPLPMVVVDPRGNVLITNDNFEFLMGIDSLPIPSTIHRRVSVEWRTVFARALESTLQREASVEIPLPPLSGAYEQFEFRLTTSLIEPHRGGPAVVFVVRDVSIGQANRG